MKTLRLGLAIMVLFLLGTGYAASQFAFFGHLGGPDAWAERLAQAPVGTVSLALVVAGILLWLTPDEQEEHP